MKKLILATTLLALTTSQGVFASECESKVTEYVVSEAVSKYTTDDITSYAPSLESETVVDGKTVYAYSVHLKATPKADPTEWPYNMLYEVVVFKESCELESLSLIDGFM